MYLKKPILMVKHIKSVEQSLSLLQGVPIPALQAPVEPVAVYVHTYPHGQSF